MIKINDIYIQEIITGLRNLNFKQLSDFDLDLLDKELKHISIKIQLRNNQENLEAIKNNGMTGFEPKLYNYPKDFN